LPFQPARIARHFAITWSTPRSTKSTPLSTNSAPLSAFNTQREPDLRYGRSKKAKFLTTGSVVLRAIVLGIALTTSGEREVLGMGCWTH